ncbi:MAG: hypothetical protein ACWA5X_02475 [bacterium]
MPEEKISIVGHSMKAAVELEPAAPLWKRVPKEDDNGKPLSDFMMLIPRLRQRPAAEMEGVVTDLATVLEQYQGIVVFADLNLKLNLLWVSLRAVPGMCLEIPAAIKVAVPEAMLVASKYQE